MASQNEEIMEEGSQDLRANEVGKWQAESWRVGNLLRLDRAYDIIALDWCAQQDAGLEERLDYKLLVLISKLLSWLTGLFSWEQVIPGASR